jgi:hypothetical protein
MNGLFMARLVLREVFIAAPTTRTRRHEVVVLGPPLVLQVDYSLKALLRWSAAARQWRHSPLRVSSEAAALAGATATQDELGPSDELHRASRARAFRSRAPERASGASAFHAVYLEHCTSSTPREKAFQVHIAS